ncbi:uncharacterized protein EDB93DRAFT_1108312, partial [Suillus bovinus]|uniref:uncharacterized protein n=1 Tax=Suillus bovinus TaxID=48563 RepID=UPI001B880EA4
MGRANAGKTSILHKVCNTTDKPEIYDTKGHKTISVEITTSENELVFKSNPAFVFHDSCGFEAGSEEEFEGHEEFHLRTGKGDKIGGPTSCYFGFCIPMDDHCRTFQRAEEKFFSECDTGHSEFSTGVLDRLYDYKNRARPKYDVRLENMQKPNTNCNILLEHTTLALDNEELQLCLISTQQSNLELCIKCAVRALVNRAHHNSGQIDFEFYPYHIAQWFPHLK